MPFRLPTIQRPQSGQVGLIVLLIMVVVLALGLSLATRTSQQAEISVQQEDTTRVFNAAEAGVEAALADIFQHESSGDISGLSESIESLDLTGSNADINYNITKSNTLETHLKQGTSTELSVTSSGGSVLDFSWAIESACESTASLLISVYGITAGEVTARHYAVGDCSGASTRGDNFISNDAGTAPYKYFYSLTSTPDERFVRVKPVYNDTDIKIVGSPATSQFTINSQAQNTLAGQEARTFEVKRTLSTAPAFMEYALVSGSSIIKN